MRDHLFYGGGEFPVYRNEVELTPFVDQPLENFLIASNVGMLEKNDWGMADLGMDSLAFGSTEVPVLVFQKFSQVGF